LQNAFSFVYYYE